jgi:2-amino-4-hydroxy-6-hydroxymethyldihydropteridine diphosphokinase
LSLAAVGFGANLGDPERTFAAALTALVAPGDVRVEALSSLWRTAPWGRTDQPDFLNAAALFATSLDSASLLARLREREDEAGRERCEHWGPRTLDLDLLFFDEEIREDPALSLPHPRLAERSFVLEPLLEIAGAWRHPATGKDLATMRAELRRSGGWTECVRVGGSRLGSVPEPACPSA